MIVALLYEEFDIGWAHCGGCMPCCWSGWLV